MRFADNATMRPGFTLIELSIVLVIIGLIVGGVLVGRDLIAAAQQRGTVAQMQGYLTGLQTFRTKFNALPGDMPPGLAAELGMAARSGASGHGDNNGFIDSCGGGWAAIRAGCETVLFWRDMATAGLVEGGFGAVTDAIAVNITSDTVAQYFPEAKMGNRGVFITAGAPHYYAGFTAGANWLAIAGLLSTNASGIYSLTPLLTRAAALSIDTKIDDGLPFAGTVRGIDSRNNSLMLGGQCASIGAQIYNLPAGPDDVRCGLLHRMTY